jgi:flagellar biosynthesis protein FliQ
MKTQIVHISKLQTSKVMAVLYLVISIPLVLLMVLPMLMAHQPVQWGALWWMPLLYAVFGFIFTFLGCWIYNGVAGWIGGIEFTISDGA